MAKILPAPTTAAVRPGADDYVRYAVEEHFDLPSDALRQWYNRPRWFQLALAGRIVDFTRDAAHAPSRLGWPIAGAFAVGAITAAAFIALVSLGG